MFETPINNTAPTPDVPGKLLKNCNAHAFCQTFTYEGDLLSRIEDDATGRGLDFTWETIEGIPRVTEITGPDLRKVVYAYETDLGVQIEWDPEEHPMGPQNPDPPPVDVRLKRVSTPERVEKYTYDYGWALWSYQANGEEIRYSLYMRTLALCGKDDPDPSVADPDEEINCKDVAEWEFQPTETEQAANRIVRYTRPADPSIAGDEDEDFTFSVVGTIDADDPSCPADSATDTDCLQVRITQPDGEGHTDYFSYMAHHDRPTMYKITGSGCGTCGGNYAREYVRNSNNRVTAIRDGNQHETQYEYDSIADIPEKFAPLTKRTEAATTSAERETTYAYSFGYFDAGVSYPTALLLTQVNQPGGLAVIYDNDASPSGNPNEEPTRFTHRIIESGLTDYALNGGDGNPAESRTTVRSYSWADGLLQSVSGPRDEETQFTYTTAGDIETVTRVKTGTDLVTTYGNFTENGTPRTMEDANHVVTTYVLDRAGRVTSTSVDVGSATATTTQTYDQFGNITSTDLPVDGTGTSTTYTTKGRVRDRINGVGEKVRASYDTMGRKWRDEYLPAGSGSPARVVEYEYDNPNDDYENTRALWKVKEIGKAAVGGDDITSTTEFGYDAVGNRTSVVDGSGKALAYTFDELSRLHTVTQAVGTAEEATTTYGYDAAGNLTSVEDAQEHITSYVYDDWNRVVKVVSPDAGVTIYNYDESGNLRKKKFTQDGRTVVSTYSYDELNRLTSIANTGAPGGDVSYFFDSAVESGLPHAFQSGRLAKVIDESGTTIFSYDEAGRTVAVAQQLTGGPAERWFLTEYGYDLNGNLTSLVYPDERTLSIVPDAADRPASATFDQIPVVSNIAYAPFGPKVAMSYGNDIDTAVTRGLFYEPLRIATSHDASAVDVLRRDYTLAANGNIDAIADLPTSTTNSYAYDGQNRLESGTQGIGAFGEFGYTYDLVGNRLTKDEGAGTDDYAYVPGTNRLDSTNDLAFDYDETGSTVAISGTQSGAHVYNEALALEYNAAGRTAAVERHDVRFEYTSDYQARRVAKRAQKAMRGTELRTERLFIHDLSGNILAELAADGSTIADYVYVGGERLLKVGLVPTDDADEDGMANAYEEKFNLDPFDASDVDEDPDGDFLTNAEEASHGTDPYQNDSDHDGWGDRDELACGTDPLDASESCDPAGSAPAYEDLDCNKIYEPDRGDRVITNLIASGPFTTADCVVIFTTTDVEAGSVSITANRGITVWGAIHANDAQGSGIALTSAAWLDLSGADLTAAAPSIVLNAGETIWLTGAHLEGPDLVTVTTDGLVTGVNAQIRATGTGGQIVVTAGGNVILSGATVEAAADVGITSSLAGVVLANAVLQGPSQSNTAVAVSANEGAGTIDIRGATIRDSDPVYTGILIGNGNPPSAAFPIFTPGQQIPATTNPKRIAVADFNNDGFPDAAVALTGTYLLPDDPGTDTGGLLILLGDSHGTLRPFAKFTDTGRGPTDVIATDLNGDGNLDLALTRAGNAIAQTPGTDHGGVVTYMGDGTGVFHKRAAYTSGNAPGALVAADFNGDGKQDLAVARTGLVVVIGNEGAHFSGGDPGATVEVFRGRGNGTFARAGVYAVAGMPMDLDAGDIDGDNKPDLAVACLRRPTPDGRVSILRNNGSGVFTEEGSGLAIGDDPLAVRFVHLNPGTGGGQDSHLDLAVAKTLLDGEPAETQSAVVTLVGDGEGGFSTAGTKNLGEFGTIWFLTTGDLNEDTRADVLVTTIPNGFSVLLNEGDGTLSDDLHTEGGFIARSIGVADFDDDGHADAAVMDDATDLVNVYPGKGDGTFHTVKRFVSQMAPVRVIHGHWDSDSTVDLATINLDSGEIKVYLGTDAETFSQTDTIQGGPTFYLSTADFDEDGDADLTWGDMATGIVKVAFGNGDGTFQTPTTIAAGGWIVRAGVLTSGDGHADLAVLGMNASDELVLKLYPGNGDGTFATPTEVEIDATESPLGLAFGDLDGDADVDYAIAYESGLVRVVEGSNTADLTLGTSMQIAQGTLPRSIVIADLDGDDDADIATANSDVAFGENGLDPAQVTGSWVSFFRNDGTGSFAADAPIPVGKYPMNIQAADLNGDGYPDLSVVHLTDFTVEGQPPLVGLQVLISNAQGGFLGPEETLVGYAPFGHTIVDLDGDGLNDAVVSDPATNVITILHNYLNVAANQRVTPNTRLAKKRAVPRRAPVDGVRYAALSPTTAVLSDASVGIQSIDYAPYWYHNDHLGTPQVMTDADRNVVWKGYYRPFGEVVASTENLVNTFRSPGQYQDGESGAYYNRHRVYESSLGRFLSVDPLLVGVVLPGSSGESGRQSLVTKEQVGAPRRYQPYSYTANRPLLFTDPTGLKYCCSATVTSVTVIVGAGVMTGDAVYWCDKKDDPGPCLPPLPTQGKFRRTAHFNCVCGGWSQSASISGGACCVDSLDDLTSSGWVGGAGAGPGTASFGGGCLTMGGSVGVPDIELYACYCSVS